MLAPKTGLTIKPNISQTPDMKPTDPLMWASGNWLASKSSTILALPLAHGFPSSGIFYYIFSNLLSIIFATL
jgi:hypothetical protein